MVWSTHVPASRGNDSRGTPTATSYERADGEPRGEGRGGEDIQTGVADRTESPEVAASAGQPPVAQEKGFVAP